MDAHVLAEARSLALHREVLARIQHQPALLDRVRDRLRRWREDPSKPQAYVIAWCELIDGPFEVLSSTMTSDDERAKSLRQATPFAGIVDARTRWRIWAAVREQLLRSA